MNNLPTDSTAMFSENNHAASTGWLAEARRVPSPNWNLRPAGVATELLVIHAISLPPEEFGGPWIDALFQNRLDPNAHPYFLPLQGLKVSSHLLISRDGQLTQYVPLELRAWHAGISSFQGRDNCNDFSIGIELEGSDTQPFTTSQYQVLVRTTQVLQQRYPAITRERIVGHNDIAPGRKTDPGPFFAWTKYLAVL